jgi:hypothetical protein
MEAAKASGLLTKKLFRLNATTFDLEYDGLQTLTIFHDGSWTGGAIVDGDEYHSFQLHISPELHRFQHEYVHHKVGNWFYGKYHSDVLWQAAHPLESAPATNLEEEWIVTALQYASLDVRGPVERNDISAINFFASRANLPLALKHIRSATLFMRESFK